MSQIRMKLVLAGIGLLMACASVADAQISQMRLFSPYPEDQFGGGAYAREGLYGSIGAGMVDITLPSTQTIGFTKWGTKTEYVPIEAYDEQGNMFTAYEEVPLSRPMYVTQTFGNNYTLAYSGNQINTAQLHSEFTSATEFEVGRMRGHNGWSVKGTIVTPQRLSTKGFDASLEIYDPQTVTITDFLKESGLSPASTGYYVFLNNGISLLSDEAGGSYKIGRLWAIVDMSGVGSSTNETTGTGSSSGSATITDGELTTSDGEDNSDTSYYAVVPIPVIFDLYSIETTVNYWSVEAMYNYRFHPFRRGMLELMAGVRYTVFDDTLNFSGHATTKLENTYDQTRIDILRQGSSVAAGGDAVSSEDENYSQNTTTENNVSGADLGYSNWQFDAENHIVGPQIGGRYTVANNHWRFTGETKFFAGLNRQNINGYGQFGYKAETESDSSDSSGSGSSSSSSSSSGSGNLSGTGNIPLKSPLNTMANTFSYSEHFTEFTPGVETKFEAAWYWTEAVSFKVGYQLTWLDEIARSTAVNDFSINEDGTYFGVKDNKDERNSNSFIHGVMFTAQINK